MKAIELRIGNLFHPIDRSGEIHLPVTLAVRRVLSIGLFKVESCLINENPAQLEQWPVFDVNDVSPIKLNKGWLKRLGFKKQPSGYWIAPPSNSYVEFYLELFGDGSFDFKCRSNQMIKEDVKYVHCLQNLFFALTGQDLPIK